MSHPPKILFVSLMNDAGSDRIVAAFAQLGAENGVLGGKNSYAAKSKFAHRLFPLKFPRSRWWGNLWIGAHLKAVIREWQPDLVIPLDDLAARTLRDPRIISRKHQGICELLERSLGAEAFWQLACSRRLISEMADDLGISIPPHTGATSLATLKAQANAFGYPVVLKRDHTCGGFGVTIAANESQLSAAFRQAAWKAGLKHLISWVPGFALPWNNAITIQKYVRGPMAFRIAACRDGVILDGVNFLAEYTHPGPTGASTMVRPIENKAMDKATEKLVSALGCSGIISIDFILGEDGQAYLIELNARPPASGHLGRLFGHDIYRALLVSLAPRIRVQAAPEPIGHVPARIALFPREIDRDPAAYFEDLPERFHDIPWDDTTVLDLYKKLLFRRHPEHRRQIQTLFASHQYPAAAKRAGALEVQNSEAGYRLNWQPGP